MASTRKIMCPTHGVEHLAKEFYLYEGRPPICKVAESARQKAKQAAKKGVAANDKKAAKRKATKKGTTSKRSSTDKRATARKSTAKSSA